MKCTMYKQANEPFNVYVQQVINQVMVYPCQKNVDTKMYAENASIVDHNDPINAAALHNALSLRVH